MFAALVTVAAVLAAHIITAFLYVYRVEQKIELHDKMLLADGIALLKLSILTANLSGTALPPTDNLPKDMQDLIKSFTKSSLS